MPDPLDRVGQTLVGRYRLVRLLGAGGMGTVYLAEHTHLGRLTAIKLLHPELCANPDAESRFRREALLAAKISHPSIAQVYDFECAPGGEFLIAMEYVEGETVAQRLRAHGPFAIRHAVRVLAGVAEGLDRAHALGILHRDLKPENIMLTAEGGVKLLDFGIARDIATTSGVTDSGVAIGTPAYMSPEQLLGESLTPASDIYALGVVFYEMLTGRQPHTGATFAEFRARRLSQPATPVRLLRDDCPAALSDVVARALDVEPKARWAGVATLAAAARTALSEPVEPGEGPGVALRGPHAPDRLERWQAHFEALRVAGRAREARLVRDAWAAARSGRTTVLWIDGEEGSGKSSFFALAQREAAADGAHALVGRGYEADVAHPYGAWMPMLRSALDHWGRSLRAWPAIDALTDARQETPPPARAALFDEVEALLRAGAERTPLFVGVEDCDCCDPASLALLEFLVHALPDTRLLIAGTALSDASAADRRTRDVRERLRRRERVVWLTLRPLSYDAVAGWLSRALGREAPDEMVRFVYGHTEGNAFFIEQVVRSLVERGMIDRLADETSRVAFVDDPPPEAVADVVQRRLRGMSPGTREILQSAAVIGREFNVDLVLQLSRHPEDDVLDALDEAVAAGVLTPVRGTEVAHGDWYRFTHNKLAQVLEQTLNARRRRRLHGQVACALEERPDTPAAATAWHWYHAGEVGRASQAARAAARRALALHDYDDALTFGALAVETARSAEERREAHELRGDAHRRLDRHGEAAAAYAHARLAAAADGEAYLDLRCKELHSGLRAGTVGPAVVVTEAMKLLQSADSLPPAKRAGLELLLAEALVEAGDFAAAAEMARDARQAAQLAHDGLQVADALLTLGTAALRSGNADAAGAAAREAAEHAATLGDPHSGARAAMLRGSAAAALGDLPVARAAFDDALRQAERARVGRLTRQIKERLAELGA